MLVSVAIVARFHCIVCVALLCSLLFGSCCCCTMCGLWWFVISLSFDVVLYFIHVHVFCVSTMMCVVCSQMCCVSAMMCFCILKRVVFQKCVCVLLCVKNKFVFQKVLCSLFSKKTFRTCWIKSFQHKTVFQRCWIQCYQTNNVSKVVDSMLSNKTVFQT